MKQIMTALAAILPLALTAALAAQELEQGFASPPDSTKPWCYWYWMSDNITREGLSRDLESMARVGIGEAFVGNIALPEIPAGKTKVLTDEWWKLVEHAIREGGRVGVNVGMFNCPGWSQSGGPWIKPEQAMRYVVSSEIRVKGPAHLVRKLPAPREPFQDIAVLAFPAPQADADTIAKCVSRVTCSPAAEGAERLLDGDLVSAMILPANVGRGKEKFCIDLETAEPFTARSLVLWPSTSAFAANCELQCEAEGGAFKTIRSFRLDRSNTNVSVGPMPHGPVAVTFPSQRARRYKLVFSGIEGDAGLAEIVLSGAARLERFIEKQLGKMHPVPHAMWDAYLWPQAAEPESAALAVKPESVRQITDRLGSDGTLTWDVPAGEWVIVRLGMTPTGTRNAPASPEGQGLEVDKMNRQAAAAHFKAFIGTLLARMPEADRKAFRRVIADSYEMGSENWTDGFGEQFRSQYGYDPRPWLPVLTGRVVGSADQSDRFLWDMRRLVADRIATEYVGGLRDLCRANGMELWLENYGHWGFPAEFLQYGGQSERIGGEFWVAGDLGLIENRAASSAGNIYGKQVISAEAFTGGPAFESTPWALKARGDWAFCEGINHLVLHVYIHQPSEDRPGVNAPFGTEFNRHNTWFEPGKAWIDYVRRCCFLLQQGWRAADVCYFIGEDTPKMTGVRRPDLPVGYDFDYINGEVIREKLGVQDGRLTLPHGTSYRVMVLPELETMRPEVLRKIRDLVTAGATVYGPPPSRSPSRQNYPAGDREVGELATELWGDLIARKSGRRQVGKGWIVCGEPIADVLKRAGAPADFELRGQSKDAKFLFTHRTSPAGEIYFVTNQLDREEAVDCVFRVGGRRPELWNPVSGARRDATDWKDVDGRTVLPLTFAPRQSWFVVFRREAASPEKGTPNVPMAMRVTDLAGSWAVEFDPQWGGPKEAVFEKLEDWSKRSEEGIRHYAGKATYRKTFDVPEAAAGKPLSLDLGVVKGLASVRLNGKELGAVWTAPWQVDIAAAVQPIGNKLEIDIITPWCNRLVGDAALPPEKRRTTIVVPTVSKDTPLQPSGLLGPVTLWAAAN